MTTPLPLAEIKVVECGDRLAVTACGSILGSLGAVVSVVQTTANANSSLPPAHREGKHSIAASDAAAVNAVLTQADVVITSSDTSALPVRARAGAQIVCDITAYGKSGPMAGVAHCDAFVQAVSGLADTTGEPDSPPTLCGFPQTEGIAALYAAAGVLTALHARGRDGVRQDIEIAMYDCAFSTLSTFLPFHFIGKPVTRSGNRHVLASPWNAYRAGDGWLLVCTGSDDQWKRLCEVIGQPDLASDPRLGKAPDRVVHRDVVDEAVQSWIRTLRAADAANALEAKGIAAGAVVPVEALAREPNIAHRGVYSERGYRSAIRYFAQRPAITGERTATPSQNKPWFDDATTGMPLAGVKVLEIGQYTTAPLVARNLGGLGAQVLKIEPPAGDGTRAWPPQQHGQGYFFALSNSDKKSLRLDLRQEIDRNRFRELLQAADVLVENLKPGSLDKLGFGPAEREAINPRLVYCAISGFGADSAYPGRPAFDTVIQAMSGIMDSIRIGATPQKTGISIADVLGGLFALIATLAALLSHVRSGSGDAIDISMQDAAAWITQWTHGGSSALQRASTLRCSDGYVVAGALTQIDIDAVDAVSATRAQVMARLRDRGIDAAPVLTVTEVAESAQARARELLQTVCDSKGREWRIFTSPIRLSATPAKARRAIGPLGEANADILG